MKLCNNSQSPAHTVLAEGVACMCRNNDTDRTCRRGLGVNDGDGKKTETYRLLTRCPDGDSDHHICDETETTDVLPA